MYQIRYKSHHDSTRKIKKLFQKEEPATESYIKELLSQEAKSKNVIYIHVPFCKKICSFCPFNKPNKLKAKDYHKYIINELSLLKDYPYFKKPLDAINFGGGTPTSLKPSQMKEILDYLKSNFKYSKDIEISVESSVTELNDEMLEVLKEGHVNRLSIGVQTFDNNLRKLLNRRGTGEFVFERIKKIIDYGFDNTSIDLIYNIPGETLDILKKDLEKIVELNVAGISFYSLMLHEKTPIYKLISDSDKEKMKNLELEYEQFDLILSYLKNYNFKLLELTKIVRDNRDQYKYMEIRHNMGDCIAVGHGAGGNIGNYRYRNTNDSLRFSDTNISKDGKIYKDNYKIMDKLFYDLQKNEVNLKEDSKLLNLDLQEILKDELLKWEKDGLMVINDIGFTFTNRGIFFGNNIISDILVKISESLEKVGF